MRIIPKAEFTTMPWRNGGGVTFEIAREGSGVDFDWRISVADVATSGPFSLFQNRSRHLCVINGNGMRLASPERILAANLLEPVAFYGDEVIDGQLIDGPCRDFNLIYDPAKWRGSMEIQRGKGEILPLLPAPNLRGVLVVEGQVNTAHTILPGGDFCFLDAPEDRLQLSVGSIAITIDLQPVSATALKP